jgi:hypothetical protein
LGRSKRHHCSLNGWQGLGALPCHVAPLLIAARWFGGTRANRPGRLPALGAVISEIPPTEHAASMHAASMHAASMHAASMHAASMHAASMHAATVRAASMHAATVRAAESCRVKAGCWRRACQHPGAAPLGGSEELHLPLLMSRTGWGRRLLVRQLCVKCLNLGEYWMGGGSGGACQTPRQDCQHVPCLSPASTAGLGLC